MATSQKELKAAYKKQRTRVTKLAARMKEKGYELPDNAIPKVPKRITHGSVRALEKLDADAMYAKATKTISQVDEFSGEITRVTISGTEARRRERSEAAIKARRTREAEVEEVGHRGSRGGTKNSKYFKSPRFEDLKGKEKKTVKIPTDETTGEIPTDETTGEIPTDETTGEIPTDDTVEETPTKKVWTEEDLKRLDEEDIGYYGDSEDLWRQIHGDETPNENIPITETEELVEEIEETESENAEKTTPPTEMTTEDIEAANERKNERDNAGEPTPNETAITKNKFTDLLQDVPTPGATILQNLLNTLIGDYGETDVYNALSKLEEIDPRLLERMEKLMYYHELEGKGSAASTAFQSLYRTLASLLGQTEFNGQSTDTAKEIGRYMDEFDEIDARYRG